MMKIVVLLVLTCLWLGVTARPEDGKERSGGTEKKKQQLEEEQVKRSPEEGEHKRSKISIGDPWQVQHSMQHHNDRYHHKQHQHNDGQSTHDLKTKTVPKAYRVEVEKKVPYEVKVPVDQPYPVYIPQPYPVYIEKKVPFEVKVPVPQPFALDKVPMPFEVRLPLDKGFSLDKTYPVTIEKQLSVYNLEKRIPYTVKNRVEKPFTVQVPLDKLSDYPLDKVEPYSVGGVPLQRQGGGGYQVEKVELPLQQNKQLTYQMDKKIPYQLVKEFEYPLKGYNKGQEEKVRLLLESTKGVQPAYNFPQVTEENDEGDAGVKPQYSVVPADALEQGFAKMSQYPQGGGQLPDYSGQEEYVSTAVQVKESREPNRPEVQSGKSYSHSSMQSNGKEISYPTTIDHY